MSGPRFVRFYPSDWRSGCIGMTFEQEGFYVRVCAFIYESNRRLPLNDSEAAKLIGANTNAYRKLKTQLVDLGKLKHTADGYTVPRAERELASVAYAKREQERPADPVRGRDTSPDTLTDTHKDALGDTHQDTPLEFSEKPQEINVSLESHNQSQKEKIIPLTPKGGPTPSQALEAFNAYNETALRCGLPQASRMTPDRQRKIIARLRDYGLDGWSRALKNIETCDFLRGSNNTGWRASLDFLLQASSFAKAHDGVYGRGAAQPKPISDAARRTQNAFDVLARMRMEAAQ